MRMCVPLHSRLCRPQHLISTQGWSLFRLVRIIPARSLQYGLQGLLNLKSPRHTGAAGSFASCVSVARSMQRPTMIWLTGQIYILFMPKAGRDMHYAPHYFPYTNTALRITISEPTKGFSGNLRANMPSAADTITHVIT